MISRITFIIALLTCLISLANGQSHEVSLNVGGGINAFTPPGGKPDRSFNYGPHVQYYYSFNEAMSVGFQTGLHAMRDIDITLYEHETFNVEFYIPVNVLWRISSRKGWFSELSLGFYHLTGSNTGFMSGIGAGRIIRLSELISIPIKIKADYLKGRDSLRTWDGTIPVSFSAGVAMKFNKSQ